MGNSNKVFIIVGITIFIITLVVVFPNLSNKTITFNEMVLKKIGEEEIRSIVLKKFISEVKYEYLNERVDNKQEIEFIMDSLSEVEFKKIQSAPPPIKDLAYELYIIGETEYLYGFIFSKDGTTIKYDYTAQKHEDGSYKIISDFNLDFLNDYFK